MGIKICGKEALCVTCLRQDKLFQYRHIMKNVDATSNLLIFELIRKHTALQLELPLPMNFPEKICKECLDDLIAAHRITLKTQKAKHIYRKAQQELKLEESFEKESLSDVKTLVQQDVPDVYVEEGNLLVASAWERNVNYCQQLKNFLAALKKKPCYTPGACEICHREFKSAQGVSCHKSRMHAELKLHSCKKGCGERFSSKTELLKHECGLSLVKKRISTPVCCKVCERWLKGKTGLGSHMRTHPGFKLHQCTNGCGESFSTNIAYKKHKSDCPGRSKQ